MKILALRTFSLSCDPILQPIARLGHELTEIVYFDPGAIPAPHSSLPARVDSVNPDLVVMLGQADDRNGNCPPASVLAAISRRRPFVHICCDGSERVWWPQLDEYAVAAPEMVHVNIDGVRAGFFREDRPKRNGHGPVAWTILCPMDQETWTKPVENAPWELRPVMLGFCGGWGEKHPRGPDITRLMHQGDRILYAALRPFHRYEDFQNFMCRFRAGYNHALTGTADHMHVKARVIETAFAGAVLVEPKGSPTSEWFDPATDYLTYSSDADLARIFAEVTARQHHERAQSMRAKAIDLYSAQRFWPTVIELAGA
jgi:hypothetical protein